LLTADKVWSSSWGGGWGANDFSL